MDSKTQALFFALILYSAEQIVKAQELAEEKIEAYKKSQAALLNKTEFMEALRAYGCTRLFNSLMRDNMIIGVIPKGTNQILYPAKQIPIIVDTLINQQTRFTKEV